MAYPVWNTDVLSFLLKGCVSERWLEGVSTVLRGNCAQHVYLCMDYANRLDFLGEVIGSHITGD